MSTNADTDSGASDGSTTTDSSVHNLSAALTALVVFFIVAFFLSLVFTVRRKRLQQSRALLPVYSTSNGSSSSQMLNAKGLTIQTTNTNGRQSVLVFGRDGQPMLANPQSPPYSPDNVPEIRITFPDEQDETGQRKSGRVVVVRLGEHNAIGMEPVREEEEQLPAYEKDSKSQFYSIDMDQIGGLKEKTHPAYQ